jgi:predicted Rossmann fold nucleotide-binding protein DprA/Smf involved in DNA uptake
MPAKKKAPALVEYATASMDNRAITASDSRYPPCLRERLGTDAPSHLTLLGNADLLTHAKTALFCSARCPGGAILRAYDHAARWRDEGRCIISGFHAPVEKECLRILLRGTSPIIMCPARSFPHRLPPDWRKPLDAGHLLILSAFTENDSRITAELAARRNEFVAALADEVFIVHATPSGSLATLVPRMNTWGIPVLAPEEASRQ